MKVLQPTTTSSKLRATARADQHSTTMPLSAEVDRVRTRVELKDDHVRNVSQSRRQISVLSCSQSFVQTSSSAYPGTYPGVDDSWSLDSFKEVILLLDCSVCSTAAEL